MQNYFQWLYVLCTICGVVVFAIGLALYIYQDKLLYFPTIPGSGGSRSPDDNPAGLRNPGEFGLPYRDVFLTTKDGVRVHGWLMFQKNASEVATILFLHGNAGNIGYRLSNAEALYKWTKCNILLMDYRGYGKSEGVPSEKGLILDATAFIEAIYEGSSLGISPHKVILFGRSLGGAVAFSAAASTPDFVSAIIVENTFLSISHMVDELMPLVKYIKPLVLRIKWDSASTASKICQPVMLISGERDELVPPWHMRALKNLLSNSSSVIYYMVANGTHNDTWYIGGESYYKAIRNFVMPFTSQNLWKFGENVSESESCDAPLEKNGRTTMEGKHSIPTMQQFLGLHNPDSTKED